MNQLALCASNFHSLKWCQWTPLIAPLSMTLIHKVRFVCPVLAVLWRVYGVKIYYWTTYGYVLKLQNWHQLIHLSTFKHIMISGITNTTQLLHSFIAICITHKEVQLQIRQELTKQLTADHEGVFDKYVFRQQHFNTLTHWGRDKMAAVSQTTLSNAFSWMKMLEFRLRFHWSLFLRIQLTIIHHWFR